jgi:transketolase
MSTDSHSRSKIAESESIALDDRSLELRRQIVGVFDSARRGHIGSAFSLVEILRVLYDDFLRYDPARPKWPGRDRFILSKGHGCIALYVLLAEKGFFPSEELSKFCKTEGILGGHPDHRKVPGIEVSTGSLGHGLSMGLGFALNARYEGTDAKTVVVVGDGESNEGSIWEAALSAGKHRLSDLTVMIDYNKNQSYGTTTYVLDLEPIMDKWRAFGFATTEVDGHNVAEIKAALDSFPAESGKPRAIVCHTVKGKGIDFVEGNMDWHHKSKSTDDEIQELLSALEPS